MLENMLAFFGICLVAIVLLWAMAIWSTHDDWRRK